MMVKKRYKILSWIFFSLCCIIAIFIILYSYTSVVDVVILRLLNMALQEGIDIKYSRLEGNLLGSIRLIDAKITFHDIVINVKTIQFSYSSTDLLDGKIIIETLVLDSPEIVMKSTSKNGTTEKEPVSPEMVSKAIDLSGFPHLIIDELIIRNGKFFFKNMGEIQNQVEKIQLESSIEVVADKVEFVIKYIKGHWIEKDINLDQLSFRLTGNKKRLTLNQLYISIDENEIFAHGEVELLPELRFLIFADTSTVQIPLIKKLFPDLPFQSGYMRFYLDYIGVPQDFTGQIFIESELDSLEFRTVSSKFDYHHGAFKLTDFKAYTNFGNISGEVLAAPLGKNSVDLYFENINLMRSTLLNVYTNVNGKLDLKFNSWNLSQISGAGFASLWNFELGKSLLDSLLLILEAKNGYWDLKYGSRLVVEQASQFFVQGKMSRDRILDCNFYTDNNNLDTLNSRLGLNLFGGLGSMNVKIYGPLNNPNISGNVLLDSLIYEDVMTYGIEGDFELAGILGERIGFLDLEMSSGIVVGVMITDGVVNLKIEHNTVHIDSTSFYNEDNYISLRGKVDRETELLDIQLYEFAFKYQDYRIYAEDTLKVFVLKDSLFVEDFVLHATGDGEIEIRGMLHFSAESGLAIYFRDIQLFPFNQFIQYKYPLAGLSEIAVQLTGYMDSLNVKTSLDIQDFTMAEYLIGNLNANFAYENGRFEIENFYFRHDSSSFFSLYGNLLIPENLSDTSKTSFGKGEQFNFTTEFANLELSDYPFFSEFNFPIAGNCSGKIELTGSKSLLSGNYQLTFRDIQYREYQFPFIQLTGDITPQFIRLKEADINFMQTQIKAWGEKAINWNLLEIENIFSDKQFSLSLSLKEDTLNFLNVLIPDVDVLYGDIDILFNLGGTVNNPQLGDGIVQISDGTLFLSKIENPITDLNVSADIKDNRIIIRKCRAKMIGEVEDKNLFKSITGTLLTPIRKLLYPSRDAGELNISGDINLSQFTHPRYNLKMKASQAYVNYFLENAKLVFSTNNLEISGRDTLFVQGDIRIHKGEVDLNLKESEKNLLISSSVRATPPYLEYLLGVEIPGNFYIRSGATFNSFDMMLSGDLRIIQEPKGLLEMNGTLNIPKGKYFQFEEFNIRDGRIEFINPKELPDLSLAAEKKKYGYLFRLNVEGNLNNPIKEIRIYDLASGEDVTHLYPETKDQIALLLFGITFDEIGSSAGSVALEKGGEVINQALISIIEREARRFIGLDEIRVESNESFINFSDLRLNQHSQSSMLSLGKYIMPNLYLEYKTQLGSSGSSPLGDGKTPQLGWEAGNIIYLEYRINRNWSISSLYAKQLSNKFKIDVSWRLNF